MSFAYSAAQLLLGGSPFNDVCSALNCVGKGTVRLFGRRLRADSRVYQLCRLPLSSACGTSCRAKCTEAEALDRFVAHL